MEVLDQPESESLKLKHKMFQNLFSFDGRIRRTEYGLTCIIYITASLIVRFLSESGSKNSAVTTSFFLMMPLLYFFLAQGAKRCHDVDKSGWWQCIPLFFLYLLFAKGTPGENEYGKNPKGEMLQVDTKVLLNQDAAKVYSLPDLSSEVIATLNKKDPFLLCINNNNSSIDWDLIKLSHQQSGYIDAQTKVLIAKK